MYVFDTEPDLIFLITGFFAKNNYCDITQIQKCDQHTYVHTYIHTYEQLEYKYCDYHSNITVTLTLTLTLTLNPNPNPHPVVDSEMSASLLQVLKQNYKDMSDEEVELKRKIDQ